MRLRRQGTLRPAFKGASANGRLGPESGRIGPHPASQGRTAAPTGAARERTGKHPTLCSRAARTAPDPPNGDSAQNPGTSAPGANQEAAAPTGAARERISKHPTLCSRAAQPAPDLPREGISPPDTPPGHSQGDAGVTISPPGACFPGKGSQWHRCQEEEEEEEEEEKEEEKEATCLQQRQC